MFNFNAKLYSKILSEIHKLWRHIEVSIVAEICNYEAHIPSIGTLCCVTNISK